MKDPERLLEGGGTPAEQMLLKAGVAEQPSQRSMHKAAAAIGLGAAAGLSVQSAAATGTTTLVAQVAETLKWVGVGVGGLGVAAAVGYAVVAHQALAPPNTATPQKVAAVETPRQDPSAPAPQPAPPSDSADGTAPTSMASVAQKRPAHASSAGSLGDQVALVDGARKQLASGQPQAALSTLRHYDQAFPKGTLGQEVMLLRIEALAQMGNRSAARELATSFLSRQPSSPHRKRIESLVGDLDLPEQR